jgi:hypothetical protein
MSHRRFEAGMQLDNRALIALALAATLATAGCLGFLSGTTTVASSPAVVAENSASDANYEKANTRSLSVNRTFSAADQERTVEVTNWVVEYQKSVSVGPLADQKAAVFATFTSPEVSAFGQSFNPLSKLSTTDFATRMQGQYGGLSIGDEVDTTTVTVVGESANVSQFEGTATFQGQELDVYVVVSEPVKHEGDYVVTMAVYPQVMNGEYETVKELMRTLEHPTNQTSD